MRPPPPLADRPCSSRLSRKAGAPRCRPQTESSPSDRPARSAAGCHGRLQNGRSRPEECLSTSLTRSRRASRAPSPLRGEGLIKPSPWKGVSLQQTFALEGGFAATALRPGREKVVGDRMRVRMKGRTRVEAPSPALDVRREHPLPFGARGRTIPITLSTSGRGVQARRGRVRRPSP